MHFLHRQLSQQDHHPRSSGARETALHVRAVADPYAVSLLRRRTAHLRGAA
jgi:hypothetical protein